MPRLCSSITTTMKNKKHCQNICSSKALNGTTKLHVFINAINMYVTFNLLFLEKQTFFENSLFMLPRQPIKLRESDKSLITVENYSINISVKIKFYIPYETVEISNFHFYHYKSIETISCHSNQSSYPTGIKNTTFAEGNVLCKYAKFQLHPPYGF